MDSTHIDYLLQLPLPRPEGGVSGSRGRDDGPPFDRHFQQAKDINELTSVTSTPPARENNSATPSSENQRTSASPVAPESQPADDADELRNQTDSDEHDAEESSANEVAVAAAPADPPAQDASKSDESATDESSPAEPAAESADAPKRTSVATKTPGTANDTTHVEILPDGVFEATQVIPSTVEEEPPANAVPSRKPADAEQKTGDVVGAQAAATGADVISEEVAESGPSANARSTRKGRSGEALSGDATSDQSADHANPLSKLVDRSIADTEARVATALAGEAIASAENQPQKQADATSASGEKGALANDSESGDKSSAARPQTTASGRGAQIPQIAAANTAPAIVQGAASDSSTTDSATRVKSVGGDAKESVLTTFARIERLGTLGSRGAHRAGEAGDMPHVDPARFVSRVARAIQTAQDRGAPLLLRLSPPELGSLRLELSVQQGALSATVEADNQNARQLLLENLPALRDRLADQNIRIERFDVDVRRDGEGREQPNFSPDWNGEQHGDRKPHPRSPTMIRTDSESAEVAPVQPQTITNTSINVVA